MRRVLAIWTPDMIDRGQGGRVHWTDADDALLRAIGAVPAKRAEAARQLGRSREAVDKRLRKLGLVEPRGRSRPT